MAECELYEIAAARLAVEVEQHELSGAARYLKVNSKRREGGDDRLIRILAFAGGLMRNRRPLPDDGGSSIHEFIPGSVSAAFKARS